MRPVSKTSGDASHRLTKSLREQVRTELANSFPDWDSYISISQRKVRNTVHLGPLNWTRTSGQRANRQAREESNAFSTLATFQGGIVFFVSGPVILTPVLAVTPLNSIGSVDPIGQDQLWSFQSRHPDVTRDEGVHFWEQMARRLPSRNERFADPLGTIEQIANSPQHFSRAVLGVDAAAIAGVVSAQSIQRVWPGMAR